MLTIFEYSVVVESLLIPCHKELKMDLSYLSFHWEKNMHTRALCSPMTALHRLREDKKKLKIQKKNFLKNCFCSYISSLNTPCALLPIIDHHPLPFSLTILQNYQYFPFYFITYSWSLLLIITPFVTLSLLSPTIAEYYQWVPPTNFLYFNFAK